MPKFIIKEIDKRKSIGQVASELEVETHVIRFWETKFEQIKPIIGAGDRRYYFEKDIAILKKIKYFLYDEGYTIAGLQKLLLNRDVLSFKEKEQVFAALDQNQIVNNSINLSDFKKQEIANIVQNIEANLRRFQDLVK